MVKILDGMRVVEGSAFVAIPLAGMTLAQMGADVIRFDRIRGGLDYHRWPVTKDNRSLFWAGLNKGKRSLAVDMATPRGQEIVTRLICAPGPEAGMFLTNLRVRGWMDYENLKKHRDDLIMLSLLGTRDGRPAVDYTVNPAVGFPFATGPEGRPNPSATRCRRGTSSPGRQRRPRCWPPNGTDGSPDKVSWSSSPSRMWRSPRSAISASLAK